MILTVAGKWYPVAGESLSIKFFVRVQLFELDLTFG
jgi:hypothetical protein